MSMKKAASLQAGGAVCCLLPSFCFLLGSFFNPEDGGDMFLVYTEDEGIQNNKFASSFGGGGCKNSCFCENIK
jgi:hypothetical protein